LRRIFPTGSVEVVGPSFSRLFGGIGAFSRLKHVVEPRLKYEFVGDFDAQDRVIRFDRVDDFQPVHLVSYGLVNRVLAKPKDGGAAFEVLSFELSQAVSLDPERPLERSTSGQATSRKSAIFGTLRFQPNRALSLQSQIQYSTFFKGLESTSLLANWDFGALDLNLSWSTRYDPERGSKPSDQLRLGFGVEVLRNRLTVGGLVSYDLLAQAVQQQRLTVAYRSSCWNVVLEFREQVTSLYRSRDLRFGLVLQNVGSLIDFRGGDTRPSR
jgi:lipopolysaccharide assembly outer membrane protein LptD (OstA)